jgi:hypothetical protein
VVVWMYGFSISMEFTSCFNRETVSEICVYNTWYQESWHLARLSDVESDDGKSGESDVESDLPLGRTSSAVSSSGATTDLSIHAQRVAE